MLLRPDGTPGPQDCPAEALKTMQILGMQVGDAAAVELDHFQAGDAPVTLYDGPIETVLDESLGLLEPSTRLYGTVWTSGPRPVIRYFEARRPRSDVIIQVCVATQFPVGQKEKLRGSKPGMAIVDNGVADVYVVDKFR